MRRIVALLFLLTSYQALAGGYIASYAVQSGGITVGTITRELDLDDQGYQLTVDTHSSLPLIKLGGTESSQGTWYEGNPAPKMYSYIYKHKNETKEKKLIFSDDHKFVQNNGTTLPISENAQDKLSYQLALRKQLTPSKKDYHYPVADGHKVRSYDFSIVGSEIIHTPIGNFDTIIVEHHSQKHHTILWFAPKLDNMIVKASFETSGKFIVNATLHSYNKKNTIKIH